ncbi:c-type cytochrome [Amorphus orientalis]|uniref:Mono/diheme cytochrome c family protein n=1 Tax=Amorphus orientalis TaxID=649198 RepID=A0AAE3VP99_9HYPH|nr:cytochrome c [Amorphus orientalis]MDQ0316299.1 mono/diheme cytochrome c family protein [Amorphus orientalis]
MKIGKLALGALVLAGAAAAAIWFAVGRDAGDTPAGHYTPNLARGAAIYAEACASCHGADLEGQPNWRTPKPDGRLPAPPHDETGHTWHHPDRVLLGITRVGTAAYVGDGYQSDMPGFGETYSDAELRDVLEWIKTQWPERERQAQAEITARDEATR